MASDVIALAAELIRMDSSAARGASNSLQAVGQWFADRGVGRRVWKHADPHAALLILPEHNDEDLLLFSGHIDVVPPGGSWLRDPFSGELADGKLHGRGASDMKAGLAAAMIAVCDGLKDGAPVGLIVTTSEETGCEGARLAANELRGLPVGGIVIPEATDNSAALGHRGALWLRIHTVGRAAHGSAAHRGLNAINAMTAVLTRLPDLPLRRSEFFGAESVNVGRITGGTVVNMVPDACVVDVDHRTIGATGPIVAWWRAQPEVADVQVMLELPSVQTDSSTDLVAMVASMTHVAREPVSFFTDASVLADSCGSAPIVVWGPGDPTSVHAPNEGVEVLAVEQALVFYRELILRWMARGTRREEELV